MPDTIGLDYNEIINGGTLPNVTITAPKSTTSSSSGGSIWDSLFSNFAGIGQGAAGIITALKTDPNQLQNQSLLDRIFGTGATAYPYGVQQNRMSTGSIIAIVVALVVAVVLIVMLTKKPA